MARFNSGWIKFYRDAADGDLGERPFLLGLFVKLLLFANWKEGSAIFNGERIRVCPGQLITGLRELSPDIEEDPYLHRVRNALEYLEKRGTITQATSNRGRLITVCNWEEYQTGDDEDSKPSAIQAQTERKQSANAPQLSKEGKKGRSNTGAFRRAYSEEFESLWELYGKEGNKSDAADALVSLRLSPDELEKLRCAIPPYLSDCRAKERRQMYFATFLRQDWTIWLERRPGAGPKLTPKPMEAL